jgi:hypothetical protein
MKGTACGSVLGNLKTVYSLLVIRYSLYRCSSRNQFDESKSTVVIGEHCANSSVLSRQLEESDADSDANT